MSSPAVSVVTATYNYAHYLPIAIESVQSQTFSDWELIIIDDGSTDNTEAVMEPYLQDARIRYIRTRNAGQPAAENRGIVESKGRHIAFLDADDYWLPTKLARQIEVLDRSVRAGVVYTRRKTIDPAGCEVDAAEMPIYRGQVFKQMFRDNFVCFSSSMVRREVFDEVGLFDETCRHASDYDLWLRVAPRWDFELVDEPLVCYRTGHSNLTSRKDVQLLTALRIMGRYDRIGDQQLPRRWRSQSYAETFCHLGLAYRGQAFVTALKYYLRAIGADPFYPGGWRGVAALAMPEGVRRIARRALGRPVDWRVVTYAE